METNERINKLLKETEKVVDPHRQFYKARFEDNSMDLHSSGYWALFEMVAEI